MTLLRRATALALSVCIPADSVVLKMVPSEAMAEDIPITQPAERTQDIFQHYLAV